MKYITYLFFIGFVVILILFLKNALQPKLEPVSITGADKCGECHKLKINGNQDSIWENSKHSQAFKILISQRAKDFTSKNNIVPPIENKLCLKCHTTVNHLQGTPVLSSYRVDEGVGCESCHGAGSNYSPAKIMTDSYQFRKNGGKNGDENTCFECHSPKGNKEQLLKDDVCPFQTSDFIYKTEFDKIKHPVNKNNFTN